MDIVYSLLIVLHLIGWAIVLGGVIATMRQGTLPKGAFHGALTALVTGLALAGLWSSDLIDGSPNNVKIAVKMVIALVIVALIFVARREEDKVSKPLLGAIAGLTVANVAIAVLW